MLNESCCGPAKFGDKLSAVRYADGDAMLVVVIGAVVSWSPGELADDGDARDAGFRQVALVRGAAADDDNGEVANVGLVQVLHDATKARKRVLATKWQR